MQRHPALRQLSSDHHTGLVLARKARQAANGTVHDQRYAWTTLVARFSAELEPHFQVEEQGLLVALWRAGEAELVERTQSILGNRSANTIRSNDQLKQQIARDMQQVEVAMADVLTRPRRKIVLN